MKTMRKSPTVALALALAMLAATEARADYVSEVNADSPVAYWRLGDASNPVTDETAGSHDGTAAGGSVFGATGLLLSDPSNDAMSLSGSGVSVNTAQFDHIDTGYTVEYLLRLDATPTGFHNLVGDAESGGDFFLMNYITPDRRIRPHVNNASGSISADSIRQLTVGETYHVVTTWDQATGNAAIFINGGLDTAWNGGTGSPGTFELNAIVIGDDVREPSASITIDEVALYDYALNATRVQAHYFETGLAAKSISLSTTVLNEGSAAPASYADGYNNNGTNSTVELIRFIGNADTSPINIAYNQNGDTIDVSPFVVSGPARGTPQGFKSNGYTTAGNVPTAGQNLYLRGEANVNNEGFGAHANWIITFDLDAIRDVHMGGWDGLLRLAGEFGAWGGIGSTDVGAGIVQGVIYLDGVRIDSMAETIANPAAVNQSFDLGITSGRWLTFAIFNGDGVSDTTLWDDGLFKNVTLTAVPAPAALPAGLVMLLSLAARRRR